MQPTAYESSVAIPLPTDEELGPSVTSELMTKAHDLNDIRMMAGTGDLFAPMTEFGAAIFRAEGVDPKLREFICLRVAKLLDSPYPWEPNKIQALNLKATQAEIDIVAADGPVTSLGAEPSLLLRAVDELTLKGQLSDSTLLALMERYDHQTCRKYLLVISWFNLIARFCNGTRIPLETQGGLEAKIGTRTSPG